MSAQLEPAAVSSAAPTATRLASVDLIRGAVMVLMAVDHVRVYSGLPAGGPTPGIFFTRWITHFCAPAFIFLAGTSAFLYGRRHADLSRFLLVRGLWLVLLELTVLRVAWTFNLDFAHYMLAGVIWVIGWCMVLMAGLVRLPLPAVGGLGIADHRAAQRWSMPQLRRRCLPAALGLWKVLYIGVRAEPAPIGPLMVLYSIVPWIGVMAAGYAFGRVLTLEPARRASDLLCGRPGCDRAVPACCAASTCTATRSRGPPARRMPAVLSFLNTTKYPASLSFLLMTLGPTIALMPLLERAARRVVARWLAVFGRVPFFFYVLHIPLIHALALVVSCIRQGAVSPGCSPTTRWATRPPPDGYTWSLGLLYLVWAVAIVILYLACRWFAGLKARRTDAWLRYV